MFVDTLESKHTNSHTAQHLSSLFKQREEVSNIFWQTGELWSGFINKALCSSEEEEEEMEESREMKSWK